jgi:hypothetical protein
MIPYGLFRPDTPGHGTTTERLDRVVLIRSRATLPHPHPHSVARSLTPTPTQAHARKLAAAPARLCSLPPSVSPSSASSMRPVHPSDLAPATLTGDEDDSGGSDKVGRTFFGSEPSSSTSSEFELSPSTSSFFFSSSESEGRG